jgi:hypothetical protein
MWAASIVHALVLVAVDPSAPPLASVPAPIYWRQPLFSIPFRVAPAGQPGQEPVEIRLHVSPDRGARWDNWRQAPPQKGYFLFRAGIDGEYWFDVRTVDRSGQVRPEGAHSPKLIVIVDTASPKIQLTARRGDAGQVTIGFRIEEPYPKLDTLAIEYRPTPAAAWQLVPVGPKDIRTNGAEHTGEVTWVPQNAVGILEIRLRVSDMAGNPAESHTQVALLNRSAETAPNPIRTPSGTPTATPPANPLGTRPPTAAVAAPSAGAGAFQGAPAPVNELRRPQGDPAVRTPWPAENAALPFNQPVTTTPAGSDAASTSGSQAVGVKSPAGGQLAAVEKPNAKTLPAKSAENSTDGRTPGSPATVGPPPGEKLHWINSRVFQLSYDTQSSGDRSPVELWGTRDGGKSWQSFGTESKGQNPMLVTVPEEGIYGFQMLVLTGGRSAGRPPLPGEIPKTWIGIDVTRPSGRITLAQQGLGRDADKLFIAWDASDNRQLAEKPIAISYSERQGGPWTAIAGNLENSGRYSWQLTSGLPQHMYLRLVIHDTAGNMGIYETPQPVTLDLSAPAAQLRELRPLGQPTGR